VAKATLKGCAMQFALALLSVLFEEPSTPTESLWSTIGALAIVAGIVVAGIVLIWRRSGKLKP
jgi:hypothetical protein